ncbi:bifunctional salicylyl-CoA 5-hydroxylase/oxidoreductase [Terricaulis sp.]|uniref:bifunctional salicylyl-CoA 5-hydroxylase/oxidoreductase n=1 Tax=Terricaulis sp. TaxID=2768686 RepID=UPI002AC6A25A|nr:bifunctional salicylyl-CoA 5-hydroxylase/oxidoreductase [Terricaulis sp.]MDZ4692241.1 bifunctional salicylyl-CoA 5-hydroxylase/oxidoreductase [Terricaulis sp.]
MRIACVGGGPAGLVFAISMKLRDPRHDIIVFERNDPGDTFGWGVVFSDQTMENLRANDPVSADEIEAGFAHWDDIDVHIHGQKITSSGHGFVGIGRKRLLNIMQDRARDLGVRLDFRTEVEPTPELFSAYDLVLACDGANSKLRKAFEPDFGIDIDVRSNKYIWLGANKAFEAFTFAFERTEHGWIWAHAYQFEPGASTFIVECSEATWRNFGFDTMSQDETCRAAEKLFAKYLDGATLSTNAKHLRGSAWFNFPRIVCNTWHRGNLILMGDAAHTAHFSIGSGTKLAIEDAIKLAAVLHGGKPLAEALNEYHAERQIEVLKLQNAARNSTEWFEHIDRYAALEPLQFTYSLLTRSQRVSHENLRVRDADFVRRIETTFAGGEARPPMFAPLKLRDMEIANRVVVSPMCMYSAVDGEVNDFHLVHYGARAAGGAGLIFSEMTDVSADARITPGCAGMYEPKHVAAWKRVVDYVHTHTDAKFVLQLAHAGRKGSTRVPWEEDHPDQPLENGNWEIIAPSPIAWSDRNAVPIEITRADMDRVKADFVRATLMAEEAGFDMIELHCGHGYLLSSFLTPVSNQRTDEYGGSVENGLRFPLEVFEAMRGAWPKQKPMSVRISATDWCDDGLSAEDSIAIAQAFAEAGADLIDVSAGQTTPLARPVYGRMFQTPFCDMIRNEARVKTMAVGNIFEADHVNSILAAGRADLVALARPHLMDPHWSLRAAAELGYGGAAPPKQYRAGYAQMQRNLARKEQA